METPDAAFLEAAIGRARKALLGQQKADGHFVFELEADVSIPCEYILFNQFIGRALPPGLAEKIGVYLRAQQSAEHDGWALVQDGTYNISSSVKAYCALKMIGDTPDMPHMQRARAAILAHGGAAATNVFTRSLLALFSLVPWHGVPVMPVEIMLLPDWFPFHIAKISYWGRTVLVPMMVVHALKPKAAPGCTLSIDELFLVPPQDVRHWPGSPGKRFPWTTIFAGIDKVLQITEPYFPRKSRQKAIDAAVAFVTKRLNGEDGLGAIYPAMAYSALMYLSISVPIDDPRIQMILKAIDKLVVIHDDYAYVQPCVSPIWDTALASHAIMEADGADESTFDSVKAALAWLKPLQVTDVAGDWAWQRPDVRPGGWAFQYGNAYYPDVDDTSVVVMAMDRAFDRWPSIDADRFGASIARAREWIIGLQSKNGGFGAFDADNDREYLNAIPFSDHGALLDPPTSDVTARCISMLAQLGDRLENSEVLRRATDYLFAEQEKDGSWYGRWGMNYIYGTWSVLCAMNVVGIAHDAPAIRKAVAWLESIQNEDGGWGEDAESYALDYSGYQKAPSTASQTAWAVLGLMAVGERDNPAVARGIAYLTSTQGEDGFWQEKRFTATGFPRVFYLRYHGYSKFFPLWAMARFRNLHKGNHPAVLMGM